MPLQIKDSEMFFNVPFAIARGIMDQTIKGETCG